MKAAAGLVDCAPSMSCSLAKLLVSAGAARVPNVARCGWLAMTTAIDFDEWAASQGASRQDYGEAGLHNPAGHMPASNWRRQIARQTAKDDDLAARRAALRVEYDRLCAAGELRPLTYRERLIRTARGHPDRRDVQAARNICLRKGWI
jgi:hypothetical protein